MQDGNKNIVGQSLSINNVKYKVMAKIAEGRFISG